MWKQKSENLKTVLNSKKHIILDELLKNLK